jgi:hypothetical protein
VEYVIRQLSVQAQAIIFYKSMQLIGYADDINITGRMNTATSLVYRELNESKRSRA